MSIVVQADEISLAQYVESIRPGILEAGNLQSFDNPYDLPATVVPFDVTYEGERLIYSVINPEADRWRGPREKITAIFQIVQALSICHEPTTWEIFERGWIYQYDIHTVQRKFHSSILVTENLCDLVANSSTDKLMQLLQQSIGSRLPLENQTSTWIKFGFDGSTVEYRWQTNLTSMDQYQSFEQAGQERILKYLTVLAFNQVCRAERNKTFFKRDLQVKNSYYTRADELLFEWAASGEQCEEYVRRLDALEQ